MSKTRFTFDDWINGRITVLLKNGDLEGIEKAKAGTLPKKLYDKGFISQKVFRDISNEQVKAFHKAVEITTDTLFNDFKHQLEKAPAPVELLKTKKDELQSRIDSAKSYLKKKLYKGDADISGIDLLKYLLITKPELLLEANAIKSKPKIIHISNPSNIPDEHVRSRSVNFFTKMMTSSFKKLLPEDLLDDFPEEIEPFELDKLIYNELYDLTVAWHFLKSLDDIEIDYSGNDNKIIKAGLVDPEEVAKLFIENSPNTKSDYSLTEYIFVMKYARNNYQQSNVSQLIRDIKKDSDCPSLVKSNKDEKAIRNWIKFYDKKAGIERK